MLPENSDSNEYGTTRKIKRKYRSSIWEVLEPKCLRKSHETSERVDDPTDPNGGTNLLILKLIFNFLRNVRLVKVHERGHRGTHTCTRTRTHARAQTHARAHVDACSRTQAQHIHTRNHTHAYTKTFMYIHTSSHMHTRSCTRPFDVVLELSIWKLNFFPLRCGFSDGR